MARAAPILSSFNAGELSPRLAGRVDVGKVGNGCKILENFIPLVQGPAVRRAGTRFVAEIKTSSQQSWLMKFEYNVSQSYAIEFGHYYLRFYTNRGQLLSLGSPYEIASPYSSSDLTAADGTFNLRFVESNDVIYLCHPSYAPRKLSRLAPANWTLTTVQPSNGPFKTINTTSTTVYASAATGTGITLTASASIFSSALVGSLFYLEQKSVIDVKAWEAGKSITIGDLRRSDGKNYQALNTATTGGGKPLHTEGAVYDGDAGVQWQYQDPGYGVVRITGYTSDTVVTADVLSRLPDNAVTAGNASTRWAYGAWSDVEGWPSQVTFFKERLVFARGQSVWLSVAGDYENFSSKDDGGVVTADMAMAITLQSDQNNSVLWMIPYDSLIVGTAGGEFAIQPLTTNQVFGPDNVTAPQVSSFGSKPIPPVRVAAAVLFVQRSGEKLRDITYDFLSNKFESRDKTVLAEHITQGGIGQIAYQQEPYSILWATRTDGTLIGFTLNKEQEVEGWHRHVLGGGGIVESVCTLPAPAGDRDDLWMIVRRTINGTTKRYVEYLEYERRSGDDPEDDFYVDCGLTLDNTKAATLTPGSGATVAHQTDVPFTVGSAIFSAGDVGKEIHYRYTTTAADDSGLSVTKYVTAKAEITAYTDSQHVLCTINAAFPSLSTIAASAWRMTVTTISGLDHLEGSTVSLLANGAAHPDCVVSSGAITLQNASSKVQVGLSCPARLQTMRLNAGSQDGTSQGKTARINKASVRLIDSLGLRYGSRFDQMDEVDFRTALMHMDNPPDLYSGDLLMDWPGDYETTPWLCFQQDYPMPCTIVGVMPIVSVYDRG